jgi:hypothetical protein
MIQTKGCGTHMTFEMSQMSIFDCLEMSEDQLTLSREDFLARLSQLQENAKDLQTALEALYFLRSSGSHLFSDPAIYFWKTSQDFSTMMTDEPSKPLSERWMNWGTWGNGVCLTARPTSPKTESEYSLSQVLEEKVDEKYFLSADKTETLLKSLAG